MSARDRALCPRSCCCRLLRLRQIWVNIGGGAYAPPGPSDIFVSGP